MLRLSRFFGSQPRGEATEQGKSGKSAGLLVPLKTVKYTATQAVDAVAVDDLNVSQDDTDSNSETDSLRNDLDETPLPCQNGGNRPSLHSIYQTHSFQQRFQKEHPVPGAQMEPFTAFMQRAVALSTRSSLNGESARKGRRFRRPNVATPTWWSFDRDYDEELEGSSVTGSMAAAGGYKESDNDSTSANDAPVYDDFLYGFGDQGTTSQLFAQQSILRDFAVRIQNRNPTRRNGTTDSFSDEEKEETIDFVMDCTMASKVQPEVISFHPRLDCESTTFDTDVEVVSFSHDNHFVSFHLEASPYARQYPVKETKDQHSGSSIQLVTPECFDILASTTAKATPNECFMGSANTKIQSTPLSSSLSSMVHSMNPDLFVSPHLEQRRSDDSVSSLGSSSATPTTRLSEPVFRSQHYSYPSATTLSSAQGNSKGRAFNAIRKKLASSFRSKVSGAEEKRVRYSLAVDKPSMTEQDRVKCEALLPNQPLLTKQHQCELSSDSLSSDSSSLRTRAPQGISSLSHQQRDQQPLSILLVNPALKVFEIVLVNILQDTTVGDTLSKARANATDESLSEQRYVSLCNQKQELAAPMLPVSLLIAYNDIKRGNSVVSYVGSESKKEQDRANRREMEARLLVAVPKGSSALICQAIRRMLWKNPKIQRWWKQSDPFRLHCDSAKPAPAPDQGQLSKQRQLGKDKSEKVKYLPLP